jgi:hypothetical protein
MLDCSLSPSTSNDFEPIADEFPRLPLLDPVPRDSIQHDDLRETFAAMGWLSIHEFSGDVD